MTRITCFSALLAGKKKKSKKSAKSVDAKKSNGNENPRVKPEELINSLPDRCNSESSVKVSIEKSLSSKVRAVTDENLVITNTATEVAYEGGDEQDDALSMKRDFSDFDLQAIAEAKDGLVRHESRSGSNCHVSSDEVEIKCEKDDVITPEAVIAGGHESDPGMGRKTESWGVPKLKRSCSNIETKRAARKALYSPMKSRSYDDLQDFSGNMANEAPDVMPGSPSSVKTSYSADRVMLKKRSSSQLLPSSSRKLWWRLFLWSHRSLHRPWTSQSTRIAAVANASNTKGGYASDTLEASEMVTDKKNKKVMEEEQPQNQWVSFCNGSSPLDRVNAWVNSLENGSFCPNDETEIENYEGYEVQASVMYLNSPEVGESSGKNHPKRRTTDEVVQANSIIQSLNTFSSVAHISGMGLKVIPPMATFTSLRAVNLSSNFIVHINPGSLPKSLHTLDLSRNKIATIEGLRELTRLRVLNLSYNKIARIGHGLSNCTAIKQLYLAGNKISDVEGLHRLLKLTVLDLSFNKITTTKALGQLVANYHSLLALNLVGNPIQSNIGDDQLRKAVSGLLPRLAYLNRQPVKPQRAREVATDSVVKAALSNNDFSSRRRLPRRLSQQSSSYSVKSRAGEGSSHRGSNGGISRSKSKSRHQSSNLARK